MCNLNANSLLSAGTLFTFHFFLSAVFFISTLGWRPSRRSFQKNAFFSCFLIIHHTISKWHTKPLSSCYANFVSSLSFVLLFNFLLVDDLLRLPKTKTNKNKSYGQMRVVKARKECGLIWLAVFIFLRWISFWISATRKK